MGDQVCSSRTLPCTTECSPKTMTFPGAETMKGGIMGLDCFRRDLCLRGTPLVWRELPDTPLAPLGSSRNSGMCARLQGEAVGVKGGLVRCCAGGQWQGCVAMSRQQWKGRYIDLSRRACSSKFGRVAREGDWSLLGASVASGLLAARSRCGEERGREIRRVVGRTGA